jgi:hypothetical protein
MTAVGEAIIELREILNRAEAGARLTIIGPAYFADDKWVFGLASATKDEVSATAYSCTAQDLAQGARMAMKIIAMEDPAHGVMDCDGSSLQGWLNVCECALPDFGAIKDAMAHPVAIPEGEGGIQRVHVIEGKDGEPDQIIPMADEGGLLH